MKRLALALLLIATSATADPITLRVSPTYTNIQFTIYKWSVLKQEGTFRECTGQVILDPANITASRVTLLVPIAGIDTRSKGRDSVLRSDDFFDAEHFPMMTFASTGITPGPSKDTFQMSGDITIRGVTKRIAIPVKFFGYASRPGAGGFAGFETDFTLDRTDFGVNGSKWSGGKLLLSKEVQVHLTVGAVTRQGP